MTWTKNDYPNSMKDLNEKVRNKAIEIANELLDENYSESRAIPIAIDRAKEWSQNENNESTNDQHVIPHNNRWAIKKENSNQASYVFETKEEALNKAKDIAKNQSVNIVIHRKNGTIQDTIKYK